MSATIEAVTLDEQIACIQREQRMRGKLYPRWVRDGKLTQKLADQETATLQAVLDTLLRLQAGGDAQVPDAAAIRIGAERRVLNLCAPHMSSSVVARIERGLASEVNGKFWCRRCEALRTLLDGDCCSVCRLVL